MKKVKFLIFTLFTFLMIFNGNNVMALLYSMPSETGIMYQTKHLSYDKPSDGVKVSDDLSYNEYTYFPYKYTSTNQFAICVSGPNKPSPTANGKKMSCKLISDANTSWTKQQRAAIAYILATHPVNNPSNPSNVDYANYYWAEVIANEYLEYSTDINSYNVHGYGNVSIKGNSPYNMGTAGDFATSLNGVKAAANYASDVTKSFTTSLSSSKLTFTLNGNNYVSNTITVYSPTSNLTNFKYNATVSGVNGATIVSDSNTSFHVVVPKSSISEGSTVTVKATVSGTGYYYSTRPYDCGSEHQNMAIGAVELIANTGAAVSIYGNINVPVQPKTITISKRDIANEDEIAGAKIQIINSSNEVVKEFTSKTTATEVTLNPGTYTLKEVSAPVGYNALETTFKFKLDSDGKVTLVSKASDYIKISGKNISIYNKVKDKTITISKRDIANENEIAGATIQIINSSNKVVKEFTSKTKATEITLEPGTYTLKETQAPSGYKKLVATFKFKIDKNGSVSLLSAESNYAKVNGSNISIYNELITKTITISKRDIANEDEIEGAKIQIINSLNEIVKEFTSKTTATQITLVPGTYTLKEVSAPKGYNALETTFKFKLDEDGKVTLLSKANNYIKIEGKSISIYNKVKDKTITISKRDIANEAEIEGAKIQIINASNKVVKEFTSTTKVKEFTLEPGTYTLKETQAPNGYEKLEVTFEFKLDKDGKVTLLSKDSDYIKLNGNQLTIYNKLIKKDTKNIVISKKDITSKEELSGATITIYNYDKVTKTRKDKVLSYISGTSSFEYYLEPGVYSLVEEAAPTGYNKLETEFVFTVDENYNVKLESTDSKYISSNENTIVLYNEVEEIVEIPDTAKSSVVASIGGLLFLIAGGSLVFIGKKANA